MIDFPSSSVWQWTLEGWIRCKDLPECMRGAQTYSIDLTGKIVPCDKVEDGFIDLPSPIGRVGIVTLTCNGRPEAPGHFPMTAEQRTWPVEGYFFAVIVKGTDLYFTRYISKEALAKSIEGGDELERDDDGGERDCDAGFRSGDKQVLSIPCKKTLSMRDALAYLLPEWLR